MAPGDSKQSRSLKLSCFNSLKAGCVFHRGFAGALETTTVTLRNNRLPDISSQSQLDFGKNKGEKNGYLLPDPNQPGGSEEAFCGLPNPAIQIGRRIEHYDPEIEPGSPALQANSLLSEPPGSPIYIQAYTNSSPKLCRRVNRVRRVFSG